MNSADEREVFPVRLCVNGEEAWFLWESSDAGDFFWSNEQGVLVAEDWPTLMSSADLPAGGVRVGDQSFFNVDAALRSLRESSSVDPELMIDIWNLLTDLFRTVSGSNARFHAGLSDTYDAYFSRCEVADFVGVQPGTPSSLDVKNAIKVLEDGATMIAGVTRQGLDQ
ncbi:hypothetical protein [Stenotrophomonas sp. PS02289]|uniref:hypothetical protein n=1 Tax=Stenotrophomonas sp. PS02289 TaxID=2991422 RepID=UPI00249BF3A9|nr:hypothetical protein [Stenotrophomonas sp. PS02289]